VKAPRGWGWFTNPKKALYNKIYNKTTFARGGLDMSNKVLDGIMGLCVADALGVPVEFTGRNGCQ